MLACLHVRHYKSLFPWYYHSHYHHFHLRHELKSTNRKRRCRYLAAFGSINAELKLSGLNHVIRHNWIFQVEIEQKRRRKGKERWAYLRREMGGVRGSDGASSNRPCPAVVLLLARHASDVNRARTVMSAGRTATLLHGLFIYLIALQACWFLLLPLVCRSNRFSSGNNT